MAKKIVVAKWMELDQTFFNNAKERHESDQWEYYLFVTDCEERQLKGGKTYVSRVRRMHTLSGATKDDVDDALVAFVETPGVRLLESQPNLIHVAAEVEEIA
ncbi:MAG TPA: hypothetical protein VN622_08985 [Clostridia bacterium]|nr:hypothetical protein [Clostridia bacterium]